MPPRKRFDKKSAKTFSIVHRAHDDSLFFDPDASRHVLVPAPSQSINNSNEKKIYTSSDLEQRLSENELKTVRENEGQAAQYGIYFDDSKYDYMQHLKPMGQSDGVYIGAKEEVQKSKNSNVEDLFKDQLPSKIKKKVTFDTFEGIPSELKGFNPDLDPRLREVLEALDDEAYITDEGEDSESNIFNDLLGSGEVENEDEFYYGSDADQYYDSEYDEWDLDNYEDEYDAKYDENNYEEAENLYNDGEAPTELVNAPAVARNSWQKDFQRFKAISKNKVNDWDSDDEFEEEDDDVLPELPDLKGDGKKTSKTKLRKKKGAMTDTTSFSMSSSAVFRTEGLSLLDDRYEQLSKKFEKNDGSDEKYEPFKMENEREDLEDMLDDFLDNYELESGGRKLVKKDLEKKKLQEAADSASRSKIAARRKKEISSLDKLRGPFGNLRI